MIDDGETDWKVVVINTSDYLAAKLNSMDDVRTFMPNAAECLHAWLRDYKSKSGQVNTFGFDGEYQDVKYAESVIEETHEFWKEMLRKKGSDKT